MLPVPVMATSPLFRDCVPRSDIPNSFDRDCSDLVYMDLAKGLSEIFYFLFELSRLLGALMTLREKALVLTDI